MTTAGIFILVGFGLAVLSITVAAYVGRHDNSDCKTDHAFIWFTTGGAIVTVLRIFVVLFYQHSSWWAFYGSYDYLQGVPMVIFLAYLWNVPYLFGDDWEGAIYIGVIALLVFGGLVIWPVWLVCWTVSWLAHHKFN